MNSNLEVEIKVLDTSHGKLEKRILSLGGEKVFDDEMIALRLDKHDEYAIGTSQLLRIRTEGEYVTICHKEKLANDKLSVAKETEINTTQSLNETLALFKILGYKVIEETRKQRTSYKLGEIKFDFDNYLGDLGYIPEFLEIEANNGEAVSKGIRLLELETKRYGKYGLGHLKEIYQI